MGNINLDTLPTRNGRVKWKECIGETVEYTHNETKGTCKIVDVYYNGKKTMLTLKFDVIDELKIMNSDCFRDCRLKEVFNLKTSEFRVNVGEVVNGKLKIVNRWREPSNTRGKGYKMYDYHCMECGYNKIGIAEHTLLKGVSCPYCVGQVVVKGKNDIATTQPWMVKFFANKEEAYLYMPQSNTSITAICPTCKTIKNNVRLSNIYRYKTIRCTCEGGVRYPERFMMALLRKYDIDYSKNVRIGKHTYLYDFSITINSEKHIIETHGEQHYRDCTWSTYKEQRDNDMIKYDIAVLNGYEHNKTYHVIDCRNSTVEWISNEIIKSNVLNVLGLDNVEIDWAEIGNLANTSMVREVCEFRNKNKDMSTKEISKHFKICHATTVKYFKLGAQSGLCDYNADEERKMGVQRAGKASGAKSSKNVEVFKDGASLGIFPSAMHVDRNSMELFGVKLTHSAISCVCRGESKKHKDYEFKYIKTTN